MCSPTPPTRRCVSPQPSGRDAGRARSLPWCAAPAVVMNDSTPSLRRRAYRLGYAIRSLYWKVRRPTTVGVRIAAVTNAGAVVVVRHSYGPQTLYLPGGRVDRGETCAQAALRELREETAITVTGGEESLELFGVYTSQRGGLTSHVVLFVIPSTEWNRSEAAAAAAGAEITEVTEVDRTDPPADLSQATRRRLTELAAGTQRSYVW